MKLRTTAIATLIALLPGLAFAQGCNSGYHDTASISCMDGTVLDPATNTCVATTG